jgi:hypothetical protein
VIVLEKLDADLIRGRQKLSTDTCMATKKEYNAIVHSD